jgi:hypothetical protein
MGLKIIIINYGQSVVEGFSLNFMEMTYEIG